MFNLSIYFPFSTVLIHRNTSVVWSWIRGSCKHSIIGWNPLGREGGGRGKEDRGRGIGRMGWEASRRPSFSLQRPLRWPGCSGRGCVVQMLWRVEKCNRVNLISEISFASLATRSTGTIHHIYTPVREYTYIIMHIMCKHRFIYIYIIRVYTYNIRI